MSAAAAAILALRAGRAAGLTVLAAGARGDALGRARTLGDGAGVLAGSAGAGAGEGERELLADLAGVTGRDAAGVVL